MTNPDDDAIETTIDAIGDVLAAPLNLLTTWREKLTILELAQTAAEEISILKARLARAETRNIVYSRSPHPNSLPDDGTPCA
jgi:hypothetical protein